MSEHQDGRMQFMVDSISAFIDLSDHRETREKATDFEFCTLIGMRAGLSALALIADAQQRQAAVAEINFREAVEAAVADHIAAVEANAVEKYKRETTQGRRIIGK